MSCKSVYTCTVEGKARCEFYNGVEGYKCDYYDLASGDCGSTAAREAARQHERQHSRTTDLSDRNPGCAKCKYVYRPGIMRVDKPYLQRVQCTHPDHADTVYECFAGKQKRYRSILDFNADGECKRFKASEK